MFHQLTEARDQLSSEPTRLAHLKAVRSGGGTPASDRKLAATVGADVTSTGGENPTVTIYYGATDGGTSTSSWDHSVTLGTGAGVMSAPLGGLLWYAVGPRRMLRGDLSPITVDAAYSVLQETRTGGAGGDQPRYIGLVGSYDQGPLHAALSYANTQDTPVLGLGSDSTAWTIGGAYDFKTDPLLAERNKEYVEGSKHGLDPLDLAELVVRAIEENELYILTEPGRRASVEKKFDEIRHAFDAVDERLPKILAASGHAKN